MKHKNDLWFNKLIFILFTVGLIPTSIYLFIFCYFHKQSEGIFRCLSIRIIFRGFGTEPIYMSIHIFYIPLNVIVNIVEGAWDVWEQIIISGNHIRQGNQYILHIIHIFWQTYTHTNKRTHTHTESVSLLSITVFWLRPRCVF